MEKILAIHKHMTLDKWNIYLKNGTAYPCGRHSEIKLSHWSLLNKTYRNSHSITQTLIAFNKFCVFILIITLPLFRFCVIESQLWLLQFLR